MGRVVIVRVETNHSQISRRIIANGLSREASAIRERHAYATSLVHYVAVGENQPIRGEHKSRAAALTLSWLPRTTAVSLSNVDFDHRWTDLLRGPHHGLGVSIQQSRIMQAGG